MTQQAHSSEGSRVALRALSCGWVLTLCVGIGLWMGGFGSDMALLSAGSLCMTRSMLNEGPRKTAWRWMAVMLLVMAAWVLLQRLSIFDF
jgi:hypothetical protein